MAALPLITHVAVMYGGKVYSLPAPARHPDVVRQIGGMAGPNVKGFLCSDGTFLNRKDAMVLAKENGQLLAPREFSTDLYSEDLW